MQKFLGFFGMDYKTGAARELYKEAISLEKEGYLSDALQKVRTAIDLLPNDKFLKLKRYELDHKIQGEEDPLASLGTRVPVK